METTTNFPNSIDYRVYFQNLSFSNKPIYDEFMSLLNGEMYTDASRLLHDSSIHYIGADILNLLDNRLVAIQDYLIHFVAPQNTMVQQEEPFNPSIGLNWMGWFDTERFNALKNATMNTQYLLSCLYPPRAVVFLGEDRQPTDGWSSYGFNLLEEVIYSFVDYVPAGTISPSSPKTYEINEFPTNDDLDRLTEVIQETTNYIENIITKAQHAPLIAGNKEFVQI